MRKVCGAGGCLQSPIDKSPDIGIAAHQSRLQEIHAADDDGKHVVEVVREAAGKLADRFHLLGLPQVLFGNLAAAHLVERPRMGSFQLGVHAQHRAILPGCVL